MKNEKSAEQFKEPIFTGEFLSIFVVNLLLFMSFQFYPSSIPLYVKQLGGADEILGFLTGASTLASIAMRPVAGMILDNRGRKHIFMLGMTILGVTSACLAFFPAVGAILFIMFVRGIGWGISSTSSNTVATDIIPRARFGQGIAYFGLSTSLALAIAPGIGIALITHTNIFWLVGVSTVFVVIAIALASRIKYKPINRAERRGFQLIEKNAVLPAVIFFFVTFTYGGVITFLAIHAQEQGVKGISWFFTFYAVATLVTRPLLGKVVDVLGVGVSVLIGICLVVPALFIISQAQVLWVYLLCAVLFGAGFSALQTSLQTLAVADAPLKKRGVANATFLFGMDSGIGLGSIVSGVIAGAFGYETLFIVLSCVPLIGGALFVFAGRRRGRAATHEGSR